jgi:hypothetical protein
MTFPFEYVVQFDEAGAAPRRAVVCIDGRSIGKRGSLLAPVCVVLSEGSSEHFKLQAGDILLRSIVEWRTNGPNTLAAIVTEVRPDAAELFVSYLLRTQSSNLYSDGDRTSSRRPGAK